MTNLFVRASGMSRRLFGTGFATVAIMLFVSFSTASADSFGSGMTLDDLVNGGMTFTARNGELLFSDFQVQISGGSDDLSGYNVKLRSNGFKLYGQRTDQASEFLDITLSYDVATTSESRVLASVGIASSKWNKHSDNELALQVMNEGGGLILDESRDTNGKRMKNKYWSYSETVDTVRVVETIRISRFSKKGKWNLRRRFKTTKGSAPDFTPVPEPNTAMLVGLGIIGLASYARRNGRRS